MHEAQMAHYHGLGTNLVLASVTLTPSEVMGLDHRIGFVKPGYDADCLVGFPPPRTWCHPLPSVYQRYSSVHQPLYIEETCFPTACA
ncbi:hypothetical protein C8R44DRAFT_802768 [Mycena epipterygia]|nr:hypothetical protein C8R44DRAFT_802768 [Mycena epipterygia]